MKKLFLPFFMFVIAMSLTACGGSNEDEPQGGEGQPEKEHTYTLVYNVWMPTDWVKFADVELSIYNPVTDKTTTYDINSADQNMFGTEEAQLFDYYLTTYVYGHQFNQETDFLFYDIATNVKDGMEYKASISITVNEEKVAALPEDGFYNIAPAVISPYVLNEEGKIQTSFYMSPSKLSVPKDKALQFFRETQAAEPKVKTGTIELGSKSQNK